MPSTWFKTNLRPVPAVEEGNDTWYPTCYSEPLDTFLEQIDCPLVKIEYKPNENKTVITVAESEDGGSEEETTKTTITYVYSSGGIELQVNDEHFADVGYYSNLITIWVVYSDTFFYMAHAYNNRRCFTYFYEVVETFSPEGLFVVKQYEGWDGGSYLQSLELKERDNEEDKLRHFPMLPYKTKFKTIDYTYSRIFRYDADENKWIITPYADDNMLSCSDVPVDVIVSFAETRHYAIDTNTLVELEPVEEYEYEESEDEDFED